MTSTLTAPQALDTAEPLDPAAAFVALALAAVSWDGTLTMAGSRALRHALDYRHPYRDYAPEQMVMLMDSLLATLRREGPQHLMVRAAEVLNAGQCATAYAVAAEIMRSDGPLEDDERNILSNLAATLDLGDAVTIPVHAAMDLLHADLEMA